jgi:hypothetical protein
MKRNKIEKTRAKLREKVNLVDSIVGYINHP